MHSSGVQDCLVARINDKATLPGQTAQVSYISAFNGLN